MIQICRELLLFLFVVFLAELHYHSREGALCAITDEEETTDIFSWCTQYSVSKVLRHHGLENLNCCQPHQFLSSPIREENRVKNER